MQPVQHHCKLTDLHSAAVVVEWTLVGNTTDRTVDWKNFGMWPCRSLALSKVQIPCYSASRSLIAREYVILAFRQAGCPIVVLLTVERCSFPVKF